MTWWSAAISNHLNNPIWASLRAPKRTQQRPSRLCYHTIVVIWTTHRVPDTCRMCSCAVVGCVALLVGCVHVPVLEYCTPCLAWHRTRRKKTQKGRFNSHSLNGRFKSNSANGRCGCQNKITKSHKFDKKITQFDNNLRSFERFQRSSKSK